MKGFEKLINLLRDLRVVLLGKYHNRLTTVLVILGSELMLDQIWFDILVEYYNKNIAINGIVELPNVPHYPYLGLMIVMIAVFYNIYMNTRLFDLNSELLLNDIELFKNELSLKNYSESAKELKHLSRRLGDKLMDEKSIELIANIDEIYRNNNENKLHQVDKLLNKMAYLNFKIFKIPIRPNARKIKYLLEKINNKLCIS